MVGESQRVGRLTSTWTMVNGLSLHARVPVDPAPAGSPVVILVHGLGVSSRYMAPTARRLAPAYRVYAPDLPGFGRSAKPPHVLTIAELADALAGWMDAVGIDRAALLGNSLGCQTIVDFALRHPERITRAVLVGPTIDRRARTALQQIWRVVLDTPREAPSQPLMVVRCYWQAGLRRAWRTLQYGLADPIEEKLPRVQVPTLVVRGARDPIVPHCWAEEVARLLPRGWLVEIPKGPHTVNYSMPAALIRAVGPFLEEDREPR